MTNLRYSRPFKTKQQGMGLVAAIFIITLMALIATGISRLVVSNQQSQNQQIFSLNALLAAETAEQKSLVEFAEKPQCSSEPKEIKLNAFPSCRVYRTCETVKNADNNQHLLIHKALCGEGKDHASSQISKTINLSKN